MDIKTFCNRFGGDTRSIDDVMRTWKRQELAELVRQLPISDGHLVGASVVGGDALLGGSLLDDLPEELREAMTGLQPDDFTSIGEMREYLTQQIADGKGGFAAFEDRRIINLVSRIKGRIGEDLFKQHVGDAASLADDLNQEGWDISVSRGDGLFEYVQVKTYSDAHDVVEKMLEVQKKVAGRAISGVDHVTPVDHIYFAVPEDIRDEVQQLANDHPGLSGMLYDKCIPVDADAAGAFVKEGISNVGPEQISHFIEELLGGAVIAGSLHAAVNGFLWYKGAREFEVAFSSATADTALSTAGIGIGLLAESIVDTALIAGPLGIGARLLLSRMARSRWSFAEFMERSNEMSERILARLRVAAAPSYRAMLRSAALRQNRPHDAARHVGQAEIASLIPVSEPRVVNAQEMKHRGV